jgi:hypothetical protein
MHCIFETGKKECLKVWKSDTYATKSRDYTGHMIVFVALWTYDKEGGIYIYPNGVNIVAEDKLSSGVFRLPNVDIICLRQAVGLVHGLVNIWFYFSSGNSTVNLWQNLGLFFGLSSLATLILNHIVI